MIGQEQGQWSALPAGAMTQAESEGDEQATRGSARALYASDAVAASSLPGFPCSFGARP